MATNTTNTSASNTTGVAPKKKTSKRRMKKQVRRTLGGLLLASAIAVAAIPVEKMQAENGTISHIDDPVDANGTYITNIVRTIHHDDSSNDSYESINGINAEESWKSKVPYVDQNETIYVDESKQFLFAYIPESSTALNKVAVLLGVQNMVGNSLVIPDTVETYLQYTGNTTTGGYCAVNMDGNFLYYRGSSQDKSITKGLHYTVQRYAQKDSALVDVLPVTVPNAGGLDYLSATTSIDVWEKGDSTSSSITTVPVSVSDDEGVVLGSLSAGDTAYQYKYAEFVYDSQTPDGNGNYSGQWKTKTAYAPLEPVMNTSYFPCYLDHKSEWCKDGVDEPLFTWEGGDPVVLTDDSNFLSISGQPEGHQRVEAVVKYIGMQRVESSSYYIDTHPDPNDPSYVEQVKMTKWTVTTPTTTTNAAGDLVENPTNGVFYGTGIRYLEIGPRLEGIGDYAFYDCSSLDSIKLDVNLNTIGNGAFKNCINLQSIDLDMFPNLSIIGASAFEACRQLTNFYVPTSVKVIGDRAFKDCTGLKNFYMCAEDKENENAIPPNVSMALAKLGYNIFVNDESLQYLEFHKDFSQKIPIHYLAGCTGLKWIKTRNNSFFDVIDGDVYLDNYPTDASGKKYAWDEGGKGEKYYHRDELGTSCDIDDWLNTLLDPNFFFESYSGNALHDTAREHSAAFLYDPEEPAELSPYRGDYEIVDRCTESPQHENTFIVDTADKLVHADIDPACSEITIPDSIGGHGVSIIDGSCFADNCSLKKIIIPGSVKVIQSGAFKGCHNLNTVFFTGSENELDGMHIEDGAFKTQEINCGHTLATTPQLNFVGPIYSSERKADDGTDMNTPFDYAMRYTNNINNGAQTKDTYITYYSGFPEFLQVQYHPDRSGEGKKYSGNNDDNGDENELVAYPTISYLSAMAEAYKAQPSDAREKYPFMTEEDFTNLMYVYEGVANKPAWANENYPSGYTADQVKCADSIYDLVLPNGIESIKSGLFSNIGEDGKPVDTALIGTTGKGLNNLGANNILKSVETNSVKYIEPYCFAGMQKLESFSMMGSNANEICDYAFFGDTALENVSISGQVDTIGVRPFRDCTALKDVSFNGSSYFVCDNAIIYGLKNGIKDSVLECLETRGQNYGGQFNGEKTVSKDELSTVTSVQPEAFMNCDKVTTVDFSESSGLKRIPERTFAAMDSLQTVRLPEGLETIGTDSFLDTPTDGMLISIPGAFTSFDDYYVFGQTKHGRSYETALYDEFLAGYHSDGTKSIYDATASEEKSENNPYIDNELVSRDITLECPENSFAARMAAPTRPYIHATAAMQQFTVSFWDANADDPDIPYDTQRVNSGEYAENPKYDPSHSGMTFKGWGLNSVTVTDVEQYPITQNTDFYAIYDRGDCTVYFQTSCGGEIKKLENETITVPYGTAATPPISLPKYDKYEVIRDENNNIKWSRDRGGDFSKVGFSNITEDTTFTAPYDKVSESDMHHVVFYNYDDSIVSDQKVADGEAAQTPANPTREGYTFTGWKPADFTNITKDLDVYAQFEKNASNGGGNGGNNNGNNNGNNSGNNGGSSSGNSSGNKTSSGNSSSGNSSKAKTYTVTVINGSGSGTYEEGASVVIAANEPAKGKAFDKWTTADVSLVSTSLSATSFKMPGKNVTVTANYKDAPSSSSSTVKYATGNSGRPPATGRTATGTTQVQVNKGGVSNIDLASATVRGSTDSFIVKVTETNEATNLVENALNNRFGGLDAIKYWPCDISLYDSTGNTKITDTTGLTVDITLPIPDELRQYGGNNKVAAVSNGQLEELSTRFNTVNGTPTVTFTATHFSPYVIYADTNNLVASEMLDASPKTGDPIHPKWFLAIALAAGSVFMFLKKDKKPAVATA